MGIGADGDNRLFLGQGIQVVGVIGAGAAGVMKQIRAQEAGIHPQALTRLELHIIPDDEGGIMQLLHPLGIRILLMDVACLPVSQIIRTETGQVVAEGENDRRLPALAVMLHQLPEGLVEGLGACGIILQDVLGLGA
ncbi:hypothetical protein D3C81_1595570 [compost metagenome]